MKRGKLALAVLIGGIALILVATPFLKSRIEKRLLRYLESRTSSLISVPVSIAELRLLLVPPGLRLDTVRIGAQEAGPDPTSGTIERIEISGGPLSLLGLRRGTVDVEVIRPRMRLQPFPGVEPSGDQPGSSGKPPSLAVIPVAWNLAIGEGAIDLALAGDLSVSLDGVEVAIRSGPAFRAIEGHVAFARGTVRGAPGIWEALRGEVSIRTADEGLRLDPIAIDGRGITVSGKGILRPGQPISIDGNLRVGIQPSIMAALLPPGVVPTGDLEADLEAVWNGVGGSFRGEITLGGLSLWGVPLSRLAGRVRIDDRIRLESFRAAVLGGEGSGNVELEIAPDRGVSGRATLRLESLDLTTVLNLARWQGPEVRGTLQYQGSHAIDNADPATLEGNGRLEIRGRYRSPDGGELPLEATAGVETAGTTLRIRDGAVTAGSARGSFAGEFTPGGGLRLRLSGATGNLSDLLALFQPRPQALAPGTGSTIRAHVVTGRFPPTAGWSLSRVVRAVNRRQPSRVESFLASLPPATSESTSDGDALQAIVRALEGVWEWDGELVYGANGFGFEGTLAGSDLAYRGQPIGSIQAEVVYGSDVLTIQSAKLRHRAGGVVRLAGEVRFGDRGRLDLAGEAIDYPARVLLALAAIDLPVEGGLSGRFDLSGRPDDPEGRLLIDTAAMQVGGIPIDRIRGEIGFTRDRFESNSVVVTLGDGELRIEGRLPFRRSGDAQANRGLISESRLDLEIRRVALSRLIPGRPGGIDPVGTVAARGAIAGSFESPEGNLSITLEDASLGGWSIGAASIEAVIDEDRISIDGTAAARGLTLDGAIELEPAMAIDLRLALDGARIEGSELFRDAPDGSHAEISGWATISGSVDRPGGVQSRLELESLRLTLPDLEITNSAPITARLEGDRFRLEPVLLTGRGTRIDLRGEIGLASDGQVDAEARGTFDLSLLRTFAQRLHATGQGEVAVSVRGAWRSPELGGELRVSAEKIRYSGLNIPIDDLEAHLMFDGSGVRIESLRFLAGGGPMEGSGDLTFGEDKTALGSGAIRSAAVRLRGENARAVIPEGFQSISNVDLELRLDRGEVTLGGRIELVRGIYSRDFEIESSLFRGTTPGLPAVTAGHEALAGLNLDCTIAIAGQVGLRNDLGRIDGEGELQVAGTVGRPSVSGRITAIEGGTVVLRGVNYRVTHGTLDFDDPVTIDPVFDIRAETSVDDYEIILRIEGRVDEFTYELTSNPALPEQDIVSLLLTGRTLGITGAEGGALAEEAASAYLAGRLTQELMEEISSKTGLDVLAVDPLYVNGQGDPTTRVTVGKRVTPDLFVSYSDQIGSGLGSIYQLDYSIGPAIRFSSVRDSDGSIGGDLSYTLRSRPPLLPGLDEGRRRSPRPEIASIRIAGEPLFRDSRLLRRARLKPGKHRSDAELHDAADRLLAFYRDRGYLMADVQIDAGREREDRSDLVVRIETGPRIVIDFAGVRGHEGLRQKAARLFEEGLFLEDIVESARLRLESYIRNRGYLAATVTAMILEDSEAVFNVRFVVRRGPRVQVDRVEIDGVRRLDRKAVDRVIRSSADTFFSRGIVRGDRLREDQAALERLYRSRGFAHVVVEEPEITMDASGERAAVTFRIDEGPKVTVRRVSFEGAAAMTAERLTDLARMESGTEYVPEVVEQVAIRLRRAYDDAGYPQSGVESRLETISWNGQLEQVEVIFTIDEGARQLVGDVTIAGNLITDQKAIRRTLTVERGDPLSRRDLLASRTGLYRMGAFRSVQVEAEYSGVDGAGADAGPAPAGYEERIGDADPFRPVRVTVGEAGRYRQVFGFGFDSDEKARGQYEIGNRNLFGTGRYLGLQTRASSVTQRAAILFRETGLFGGRFDALASAFWQDEELTAFDVRRFGASYSLNRQVSPSTRIRYGYTIEDVDLSEPNATFDESTLRLSSLSMSASHDTRDSPFNPLRGHYLAGEFQISGRALGSQADFSRYYAQIYHFREVWPNTVWAQAIRLGAAIPFGRSEDDPTSTGDAGSGMPPTRRFFAGGDTTVRGFERDRLGPVDASGDPVGGEGLFVLNEELRFPIYRKLQGVVFYDAGNVYRTLGDYSLRDLRHVAGAGLRVATPIGPFRVEYGAILDREETDRSRGEFFFSIGQAF